jgi:hypothetical protein
MSGASGQIASGAWLATCIAIVLVLPGAVALLLADHRSRGFDRLAIVVGVSVTLWPLAFLWSSLAGLTWSTSIVWLAVFGLAAGLVALVVRQRPRFSQDHPRVCAASVVLAFVLVVAVGLRVWQAREMVVVPWVDGFHHTLITQLMLDGGTLPDGFRPYMPVDGFYYHFGFHVLAATVSWLSGASAAQATLWTGQALSALATVTIYALALRLTQHRESAVLAAAVPAAVFFFPSYYLSWGRYTQLAGLVALPVVWILVTDATVRARPVRVLALAAACSAGLLLVHYRVFVFFLIGVLIMIVYGVATRRWASDRAARLVAIGVAGTALAAPWLALNLSSGVRSLSSANVTWFGGPDGVESVPEWLFSTSSNDVWIGFAIRGLLVGLAVRWRAALMLAAFLLLATLAVYPQWLGLGGLGTSWALPPFALAISVFVPVALGMALLSDAGIELGARLDRERLAVGAALVLTVLLTGMGARQIRDIANPDTVIATAPDVAAAQWISANTPADARFLVSTYHWHLGTYRGLDGGYWLPLLAGRDASIPPSFYVYGDPEYASEVSDVSAIVQRADALTDEEIIDVMERTRSDYVYIGPASEGNDGKFTPERFRQHRSFEEVFGRNGVYVFRLLPDER